MRHIGGTLGELAVDGVLLPVHELLRHILMEVDMAHQLASTLQLNSAVEDVVAARSAHLGRLDPRDLMDSLVWTVPQGRMERQVETLNRVKFPPDKTSVWTVPLDLRVLQDVQVLKGHQVHLVFLELTLHHQCPALQALQAPWVQQVSQE